MNRRTFVKLAAVAAFPPRTFVGSLAPKELHADVVIIGGGLGGCAAALAAARNGLRVILTEETDWLGGQLTQQAVPLDEHPWIESFGRNQSYKNLRDRLRDYYRRNYPLTAAARASEHLNPGNGSVSRLLVEPRVAVAVIDEILAPHVGSRRLLILRHAVPKAADVDGHRVRAVTVSHEGRDLVLHGRYFLDATERGDLLPLTKTENVIGFESQKVTGEPHAPAEAQPANHQAFTHCFAVDYLEGDDHTIDKPDDYAFWRDYVPKLDPPWPGRLLSWSMSDPITLKERAVRFDPRGSAAPGLNLWLYRRLIDRRNFTAGAYPSDITLVNWPQNDYWLGSLIDVPPAEEERHRRRAKDLSLSLLYWMQTEAPRPDGGAGWKGLRLRPDVVDTHDGLAKAPYIREARRIQAEFTVLEQHIATDARMKQSGLPRDQVRAESFADSVGLGCYRLDLHPSSGGDNYIDMSSLPFQIPLGALLPQRIDNLFPACKNLGVTHLTNGCFRLHPVEWNTGEAAGALATFCIQRAVHPRAVRKEDKLLADFQRFLRNQGAELHWPQVGPI